MGDELLTRGNTLISLAHLSGFMCDCTFTRVGPVVVVLLLNRRVKSFFNSLLRHHVEKSNTNANRNEEK